MKEETSTSIVGSVGQAHRIRGRRGAIVITIALRFRSRLKRGRCELRHCR